MDDVGPEASIPEINVKPDAGLAPVGEWLSLELIEMTPALCYSSIQEQPAFVELEIPAQTLVIGFTYVDKDRGFSLQGWPTDGRNLDESHRIILRGLASNKMKWRRLSPEEIGYFEFECPPAWVTQFYGPQPPPGSIWGVWRHHPKLQGQFLPDFPDDLKVIVHDGGPRLTRNKPEAVWVSVRGGEETLLWGKVLNQPHQLRSVRQGSDIKFLIVEGAPHPIMVTDKYLAERDQWMITPCNQCGLSELFDAPSDLIKAVFPKTPPNATMGMFTAFCPLCGGGQVVTSRDHPLQTSDEQATINPRQTKRPWWKFWG